MALFPDRKPDPFDPDGDLQQALDNAMASLGSGLESTPIAIVALNESDTHGFAGLLETEIHYSASLLKTAGRWAAFELRRAANEFIAGVQPAPTPENVIPMLRGAFDDAINESRVSQLAGANLDGFLLPRWDQVFTVQPDSTVNFSQGFFGNLFDAIVDGDNTAAGAMVHGLGFGYLTKAAATAEFFDDEATADPETADGMWLCGDFGNGFPPQRIPCVNDESTAQGTSVRQMARLFTFLAGPDPLVDAASDAAMLNLLFQAVQRTHFFLSRDDAHVQFRTRHSKIGVGPLKSGTMVASEAAIVREDGTGRDFVVVFQNRSPGDNTSLASVSQVVDATIANFLFP